MIDIVPDLDVEFDLASPKEQFKLVSNSLLRMEIADSIRGNRVSERLAKCFMIMVENQKAKKWHSKFYCVDLIPDAIAYLSSNILKFYATKHDSDGPYTWIITIIDWSFRKTIQKDKMRSLEKEFLIPVHISVTK
jgi:hypothetical protein